MEKRSERVLTLAGVVTIVWLVVDLFLGERTYLVAVAALVPYLAVALAIALLVLLRVRLARLAEEEKRDQALARKERADTTLFEREEGKFEPFTLGRTQQQLERFLVPSIAPLLALGEGLWAWYLYRGLGAGVTQPSQRLLAASFLAAQTFIFFLFSRYLLGLSRDAAYRLLRGPGVSLGMACVASFLVTISTVVSHVSYPLADRIAAIVLIAFLAVLAVENLVNLIGELYLPRRGKQLRVAYESRLGGLLTDPGTWAKNVAQALDYQFGVKVSETWLYRFLESALLPLIIFQLLVLYLLSCFVFLGPDEEGILERFGKPVQDQWHLDSGLHVKWPWPFETVRRFPTRRIQSLLVGHGSESKQMPGMPVHKEGEEKLILWTVAHMMNEENFLAASRDVTPSQSGNAEEASVPVNLLAINVPVFYQITNVYQYAYTYADPRKVVEQIAYRSVTIETATHGLFDVMGQGLLETARELQKHIQAEADRLSLGIRIVFVGVQGVHPPVTIADAFQAVIGATEEKEASIHKANAEATKVTTLARADSAKTVTEAQGYTVRRIAISQADSQRFVTQADTFAKSPRVYRAYLYLGALADGLANTRKYIVAGWPASEVFQFNFEEKLRPELFDLETPAPKETPATTPAPPTPPPPPPH